MDLELYLEDFNSLLTLSAKKIFIKDWYGTSLESASSFIRASKYWGSLNDIDSVEGCKFVNPVTFNKYDFLLFHFYPLQV